MEHNFAGRAELGSLSGSQFEILAPIVYPQDTISTQARQTLPGCFVSSSLEPRGRGGGTCCLAKRNRTRYSVSMKRTEKKLYNAQEAAEALSLCNSRIRQICRWNSIGTKIGRDWILTDSDIAKLRVLENRKKNFA